MHKKAIALLLILYVLMSGMAVVAEHTADAELDYQDELEQPFNEATAPGMNYWDALELFKKIVENYEKKPGIRKEGRAVQYYNYAQGMILFNDSDYTGAASKFKSSGDLAFAKEYISFANGMAYKQAGTYNVASYKQAMAAFEAAYKCDNLVYVATTQHDECLNLYLQTLHNLGDEAYAAGQYEVALGYYEALSNEVDIEGMQKYNMCLAKLNHTEEQAVVVHDFTDNTGTAFDVTFSTTQSTVELSLRMCRTETPPVYSTSAIDIEAGENVTLKAGIVGIQAWRIDGLEPGRVYTLQIEGMLPNTDYWLDFTAQGQTYSYQVKTASADMYEVFRVESVYFQYYSQADYMTDMKYPGQVNWVSLNNGNNLHTLKEDGLVVGDGTIGYVLRIKMKDGGLTNESLSEHSCQIVIHVDEIGTVATEPSVCGTENNVLTVYEEGKEKLMLDLTEALKATISRYPEAIGRWFSLECLLDGKLLCSASNTLK